MADYASTAREALAQPVESSNGPPRRSYSQSPVFSRRSRSQPRDTDSTWHSRLLSQYAYLYRRFEKTYSRFSPVQRILIALAGVVALVLGILFLVFNERIFHALAPFAKRWRDLRGGWLILWFATFFVSFPPLLGYSSAVTLAGFVYGVPEGWLIVASASVIGSTASFLVSRTLLKNYVTRITENDKRFAALSLTLKHDGIKLLVMIRLCPLPYSLSNGAISTIPTVQVGQFALATLIATPKLLLHVFVGSRIGAIAESGDKMDPRTKAVSYASIAIGVLAGAATGWFMYIKTKARAKELEDEEREAALGGVGEDDTLEEEEGSYDFEGDLMEREATAAIRGDDGISLRSDQPYRDAFSSDESESGGKRSIEDVFGKSDGDEEEGGFRADRR